MIMTIWSVKADEYKQTYDTQGKTSLEKYILESLRKTKHACIIVACDVHLSVARYFGLSLRKPAFYHWCYE